MTTRRKDGGAFRDHDARQVQPKEHDPYRARAKPKGALQCPECGLVCEQGRWRAGAPPVGALTAALCPACERARDRNPAGTVRIGARALEAGDEVVNLIRNVERAERAEHPLERIMELEVRRDGLVVTTTGLHLARRIGNAVERRFHGDARIQYLPESSELRVDWE